MKQPLRFLLALGALVLGFTAPAQAAEPAPAKTYTAALLVSNRAGKAYDAKIPVLEDLLTARLTDLGLNIVSREIVVDNLRKFDPATASSARLADSLEAQLSDQSSAIRLAQGLGVDYLLVASITSYSENKKRIKAYGQTLNNHEHTLRVTYKILDAQTGGSVTGDVARASRIEQGTANVAGDGLDSTQAQPSAPSAGALSAPTGGSNDDALAEVAKRYEKAVALVVLVNGDKLTPMATAWAIDPSTFATNAHVSAPVSEVLAKGGTAYVVLNRNPDRRFRILKATTHPRYEKTPANLDGRRPAVPSYDVGLLHVEGSTDVWFPIAAPAELARVDSGYRIAYLGFPMEGLAGGGVDPRSPVATMQSGIITSATDWWQSKADYAQRLLIQHNLGATGGASGSPIFNPRGEVVALLNAGNIIGQIVMTPAGPSMQRAPSAALVNFGQRVDVLGDIYRLKVSTASADNSGAATFAVAADGTGSASAPVSSSGFSAINEGLFDDLLDETTEKIASSLRARIAAGRIAAPKAASKLVTITIKPEAADLFIPDVRINAENVVTIGESKFKVTPFAATVEVDGVAVGTAPGQVTLKPGFSRLRLTREGFETWERTINATEGQVLTVAMKMSDEGYQRFIEATAFLNALKNNAKLTDAQVKVLEGHAKSLENSFFRVDTKENFRFILPEGYREVK